MMGRTHALLGLSSLWLIEPWWRVVPWGVTDELVFAPLAIGVMVGALLPDLDIPGSLVTRFSLGGARPLMLAARWLNKRYGHRGALHSLRGWGIAALLACPLLFIDLEGGSGLALWSGLVLGYASHLLGDGLTRSGIPLLYPNPRRVHLLPRSLRLLTGSIAEDGAMILLGAAALGLLLRHLPFSALPL